MTSADFIPAATRRSIALLSTATFSSMVGQRICDAMLPELSRVFAVGLPQAAQVVSVFAITYGICQLIWGPMGDRLGKYRVVTWSVCGAIRVCPAGLAYCQQCLVTHSAVYGDG